MNVAYNMDCLEAMRQMEDNAFDLAVVDPPYRDMQENHPTKDMRNNGTMERFGNKPSDEYWKELFRVSRNQIVWGANNFLLPPHKGFIVWKKKTISENFTMSMAEIAFISEGLGTISKVFECQPQGGGKKEEFIRRKNPLHCTVGYFSTTQSMVTRFWIRILALAQAESPRMMQGWTLWATRLTRHTSVCKKNALRGTQHK